MIIECPKCQITFDNYSKWQPKSFCSRKCANSRVRTEDIKSRVSATLSGRTLSKEHVEKISGDKNHKRRGKNLPPIVKEEKSCPRCKNTFVTSKGKFCSRKCWLAFIGKDREEKSCRQCETIFTTRTKTKFCCKACWLANNKKNRTAFEDYKIRCKFNFDVKNYPNLLTLELIEQHGWYSAKNKKDNPNGISRDHKFSVKQGFLENVDPYYISHPVNCALTPHTINQRKYTNCSITLEQLIVQVNEFDNS